MNKVQKAIISEAVALALDSDLDYDAIISNLDMKEVNSKEQIKATLEDFIYWARHGKHL